ncbi:MAG: prepilin-type N-terminal cleavage/methylation domain-containing protein [Betaproteobacteria bacterium]
MKANRIVAPHRPAAGFTLVEVMVALLIMAILAGMAFRGVDALVHAKDAALASTDRTLKLNTGMSQFEYDVSQVIDSKVLPQAIMFDGATLRIARRTPDGVQLVLWTLQDRRWQRWASAPNIHMSDLTDAWMRSQQWNAISGNAVTVLENVDDFQVYVCNPAAVGTAGCSWNNVQSTQGTAAAPPPGTAAPIVAQPSGIRITLKLPEGELMRERELPRWGTT